VLRYVLSRLMANYDSIDELKGPQCGSATEETEKDAEVEKSDYIDKDTD
jgi:hypothetical protein